MSKVLIDRELLEGLVALWSLKGGGRQGSPGHCHDKPGIWDQGNREGIAGKPCAECAMYDAARAILARPAEAEGALPDRMEVEPYQTVHRGSVNYRSGWNAYRNAAIPVLAAVTAERDRLLKENERLKRAAQTNWNEFADSVGERDRPRAEVEGLRKALEQFADDRNWCYDTCNISRDIAKAALAAKEA